MFAPPHRRSICVICRHHWSAPPVTIVPLRDFFPDDPGRNFTFIATFSVNCILLGQCLISQAPPPAFTSHLPLGKQVLMVPGEGIMRRPARAREVGVWRWRRHAVSSLSRHYKRQRGRRPRPQLTLEKPNLYVLHKGFTCPGGVFRKNKTKTKTSWTSATTKTHHRPLKVAVQRLK